MAPFPDNIFRCIFMDEQFCIGQKFYWSLFLRVQLTIILHYHLNQCWPSLVTHICCTWGRWVKSTSWLQGHATIMQNRMLFLSYNSCDLIPNKRHTGAEQITTHQGLNKIMNIWLLTSWTYFSQLSSVFLLKLYRGLFLSCELTISLQWFRSWNGTE